MTWADQALSLIIQFLSEWNAFTFPSSASAGFLQNQMTIPTNVRPHTSGVHAGGAGDRGTRPIFISPLPTLRPQSSSSRPQSTVVRPTPAELQYNIQVVENQAPTAPSLPQLSDARPISSKGKGRVSVAQPFAVEDEGDEEEGSEDDGRDREISAITGRPKRPRRKFDEVSLFKSSWARAQPLMSVILIFKVDRNYHCNFVGCGKAYGTLNHLVRPFLSGFTGLH